MRQLLCARWTDRPARQLALLFPAAALLLAAACSSLPGPAPEAQPPAPRSTHVFLPLVQQASAPATPAEATAASSPEKPQRQGVALHLPLVSVALEPQLLGEASTGAAPQLGENAMSVALAPGAVAAASAPPAPASAPAAPTAVAAESCKIFPNVRITWYELGSCCDKAPGHPQYGITRSGLPVAWGMAAVQANVPLLPMGTRFIVRDLGPDYVFVVADTGSETAFGSSWVDIYAPTIPVGHWVERGVADGRSDVLVCTEHN